MAEQNVLVIAYYFPPMGLSGVQRTLKFVKYLPQYGWKPFVLTSTPNFYYAYDEKLLDDLEGRDVEIFRTPSSSSRKNKTKNFPSYFTQKLGRAILQTIFVPDSKIRWKKKALKLADEIIEQNDITAVYATAPPFTDFLIALEIAEKHDIPFIIDYRDVWIDNPFHFATPLHRIHRRYSISLEKKVLTRAQKVLVTTRHTKELLIKRYRFINYDDILIVPHGYDSADFEQHDDIKPDRNKFILTHSGLFQDNRTPKYFLKALAAFFRETPEAQDKTEARFLGLMRKGHLKYIKKYGLSDNVNVTGYLTHSDVIKNLLQSDVLWFMLNDTVRSPGKLYEYFGAQKPILACLPEGVMRAAVLESKAAIATDPKDVEAIKQALTTYYKLWKNNSLPFPSAEFINKFDRESLTGELARELTLAAEI